MKSFGLISSRNEPTAESAMITSTPIFLSAAKFALDGTSEGLYLCPLPCRDKNAILNPRGSSVIVILLLG
ncbi:hypothetical protein RCL_jg13447.t1 [Rhizophagus clarus]|uniref:Uncharacterized protein n=1 Tax=Rhizophagus clarus TaxID=94130 RepID=A0A8H3QSL6_9GLOM|nr:hypothetical protein RCL_jg13447.t1 [Rhizophagus clarus]